MKDAKKKVVKPETLMMYLIKQHEREVEEYKRRKDGSK